MTNKEIKIAYKEYEGPDQLEPQDRELAQAAIEAMAGSYAPYSQFNVGAAIRLDDGEIIKGANQENAAYPSGLCAERTALFYASARHLVPNKLIVRYGVLGGVYPLTSCIVAVTIRCLQRHCHHRKS